MGPDTLPPLTSYLIAQLDKGKEINREGMITVNPVVSEVATWYEKFRNAMDYREDDVLLRAAVERILKRRMLLGGTGESIAQPLVRELIWARYFPDNTINESFVKKVAERINLYIKLQNRINTKHRISKSKVSEWIMHFLSSDIAKLLNPNSEKDLLANFMFQIYRERVFITDDTNETRDVQVFIATRRTFAKEDLPLLRYNLFIQLFGTLTEDSVEKISDDFSDGYKEIQDQLNYPSRDKIYTFIKKQTIPFFILEEVFKKASGKNEQLLKVPEQLNLSVLDSCNDKYRQIKGKVRRAIFRGVIFIFVTKAIFALAVEGTFESLVYGSIIWGSIALNTFIPPVLMVIAGLFIKTPGKDNSVRILERIHQILFDPNSLTQTFTVRKHPISLNPVLTAIFWVLWILALVLSLGSIVYILTMLDFNPVSQLIFIFFLAIVSFISYRINQTAHMYTMADSKQSVRSLLFDFFFTPFIHLGRNLTENISKLNLLLFVFDYVIETPFKGIFAFFEEWFLYLRTQREKLG